MGKAINRLRELSGVEGVNWDDNREDIDSLLEPYEEEHISEVVHSEFEDGGRWSNMETNVYKVVEGSEVAYFRFWNEVPASEVQEGMDLDWSFDEVVPKEVLTTIYVTK